VLRYRKGPESDPFHYIYSSQGWLRDYDPPRPFPFFVNVEPTNVCQLDCLFCSRQLSSRPLGYMGMDLAEKLFREAGRHEGAAVRLAGWGEPLLHPEILGIVEAAKREGLRVKIYTNGLALTDALMQGFIGCGLDELQFSFQGLSEAQYLFNRRKGSWRALSERIEAAYGLRGDRPRPFMSVLTSVLENELKEGDPERFVGHWLKHADKVAVDLTNLNFVKDSERVKPFLKDQSGGLKRGPCVDVFLALEVKYDGSIQFCGQDANGRPEHTIGGLRDMSLAEAWHSPRMEAQRSLTGRGLGHASSEVCRNCYHNTSKYDLFKARAGEAAGEGA
jgi:MoaA/NifB/PqqE/SkfB family radical SAM enzyme